MDNKKINTNEPLLEMRGLRVMFPARKKYLSAVDSVDLTIHPGEIVMVIQGIGDPASRRGAVVDILQKEMNLSLLFISHDIGVVRYISHRIGVMYLGTLVEEAETEELFADTLHPYTQALFASVPDISVKAEKKLALKGELPVRTDEFKGCVFHTRCPHATDLCRTSQPDLREVKPGHKVACHLVK